MDDYTIVKTGNGEPLMHDASRPYALIRQSLSGRTMTMGRYATLAQAKRAMRRAEAARDASR